MSEPSPRFVTSCLSHGYVDGSELEEYNLKEALAKHTKCWEDAEMDSAVVRPAVTKAAIVGHESTTVIHVDTVSGSLERVFQRDNVRRAFRNFGESYRPGPAEGITEALVAGSYQPE